MENDELDRHFIDAIVVDAGRLISLLEVEVSSVPPCRSGSQRYQSVSDAYEQLSYADKAAGGKKAHLRLDNGRTVQWVMGTLWKLKQQLSDIGEGVPRPDGIHGTEKL